MADIILVGTCSCAIITYKALVLTINFIKKSTKTFLGLKLEWEVFMQNMATEASAEVALFLSETDHEGLI